MFPLLPKLIENSAVNPDKSSVWEDQESLLTDLVSSLDVSADMNEIGHIDSIPDVWAKPLLFQMALFDDGAGGTRQFVTGLHDRVKGEWRALLAMLALKDIKHLDISAEEVSLRSGSPHEPVSDLEYVLQSLSPKDTVSKTLQPDWGTLYLIFYKGKYERKLIAMTSPTTLLSTAADYQADLEGQLEKPWSSDGKTLTDPIPYLTDDERAALYAWLLDVSNHLGSDIPPQDQSRNYIFNGLKKSLEEYMSDIKNSAGRAMSAELPLADSGLKLHSGIFRLLNKTAQAKQADARDSAVRLIPSRSATKAILVVSPEMVRDFAKQEGIPATQLVVWLGLSANDVSEEKLAGDKNRIGGVSLSGAEYRRPEDFFTERMVVMEPGDAIPGSRQISGAQILAADGLSAILPVRRELLDYFTPREIAERLTIETTGEDIRVQFSFPLSGPSGAGTNFRFERCYSQSELIFLQTNIPVIEIWPNIKREGWNKYYLYYENSEAQTQNREAGKDFFYVEPWLYGKDISGDVPAHGMANRYTARMDGFPDALICTVNATAPGSAYAQPIEAGLLLPKEPAPVSRNPSLSWKVGIDFGTSSTMVYCRKGTQSGPQPLVIHPNLFQITESGTARNATFESFIPSTTDEQQNGSFLSIFHVLNLENTSGKILPLKDGHVFWLNTNNEEIFARHANAIDANLKWKDDAEGRMRVAAYVKQICLQALAEAAKEGAASIEWNFSYPTAFSKEQQFAFQETCREAVQETCDGSGLRAEFPAENIWSESKAAAYHFNKLGGRDTNFSAGAICLDIGAGTSDVSVISGQPGRIVYHTSVQFAGRYLFQPIYRNYSLFSTRGDILRGGMGSEMQNAIIDADMREHSEEYLGNLKNNTGREEVKRVLQLSQLGMAGIFHYLGSILGTLHEKGVFREDHVPSIYVGGNGSRIFYWLTGGVYNMDSPFMGVLKNMMVAASGLAEDALFRIHISQKPKIEVASGMIEEKPNNDKDFYDEARQKEAIFGRGVDEYAASALVSGGEYTIRGEARGAGSFISANDISEGIVVESVDTLKNFLERFNRDGHIWSDGFALDETGWQSVLRDINGYYVSEKGKEAKTIFVEPVFITGMKKLMGLLQNG